MIKFIIPWSSSNLQISSSSNLQITTSSHHHIIFKFLHLQIFKSPHLQIIASSHLLIFKSSNHHIFKSSHHLIFLLFLPTFIPIFRGAFGFTGLFLFLLLHSLCNYNIIFKPFAILNWKNNLIFYVFQSLLKHFIK